MEVSKNRNPDNAGQPTPAWGGYSQQEYVQPHVQRNVPQWHGNNPYGQQYQQPQLPIAPSNRTQPRRPPYPSHLVQFPAGLLGFSGRRSRGPSFWRMVWLGTHPIALLVSVFLIMFGIELWMMWLALVLIVWLTWVAAVTLVWLVDVAVNAMRR